MSSSAAEKSTISSFANTIIAGSSPFDASALFDSSRAFNVCHVGVVLRSMLLVLGALAVGVMFMANSFMAWVFQMAVVTAIALPCLLLWLVLTCILQVFLCALSRYWQLAVGSWQLAVGRRGRVCLMRLGGWHLHGGGRPAFGRLFMCWSRPGCHPHQLTSNAGRPPSASPRSREACSAPVSHSAALSF